ncbi:hypothetical protein FHT72_003488 [Rhizobium sp. BK077]|uniref:hypothetical protein n=1 Tax=Rhizobium TaxID=379 RepID=UPI000F780FBD|nr:MULTISPECIES: hypothetical protein [Rhizobium]MBB3299733.1 hypothetical protein [Rhizobium sp. BK112]MBB3368999.1 hypothetical protein [Rhizobium sp. BK077]MBB4179623.1 hypothetical protein [Rhizobium sp. BK109]
MRGPPSTGSRTTRARFVPSASITQSAPTAWRDEVYRRLAKCGGVDVGAIYPPEAGGRLWRWRIWLTASGTKAEGTSGTEAEAQRRVEERFRQFLTAASLSPSGSN